MAFKRNRYLDGHFIDLDKMEFDKNDIRNYTIPLEFDGRPDLISFKLYGDASYQVFLTYLNRIYDTPSGFYSGRKIKYIDIDILE